MRHILTFACFFALAFAGEVQVSADKFVADEASGVGKFIGNVVITKDKDILKSNRLIINFNKKRKPTKYEAQGDASINVFIDGKEYFGSGKKLTYNPIKNIYTIQGNAFFHEKITNKKVYGDKIIVNQKSGQYEVSSKKNEPVKFIFHVEDKKIKQIKND